MPTIVVKYFEDAFDSNTNLVVRTLLGTETLDNIDEAFIPAQPLPGKPIFFTKKFSGLDMYRWQVQDVSWQHTANVTPVIYEVVLKRHPQLDKKEYLSHIVSNKPVVRFLQKYTLVEVEFGHAPSIGKVDGRIGSNKRYPDSVQRGNMPKRRLAIVLKATHRSSGTFAQVVPISSVQPYATDKTVIDVTASLIHMASYQKQSWAICSMVETVPATRIIAPLVNWGKGGLRRDSGFSTKLAASQRDDFEEALMHGLDRGNIVREINVLRAANEVLQKKHDSLQNEITTLAAKYEHADTHEKMARAYLEFWDSDKTFDIVRSEFSANGGLPS